MKRPLRKKVDYREIKQKLCSAKNSEE